MKWALHLFICRALYKQPWLVIITALTDVRWHWGDIPSLKIQVRFNEMKNILSRGNEYKFVFPRYFLLLSFENKKSSFLRDNIFYYLEKTNKSFERVNKSFERVNKSFERHIWPIRTLDKQLRSHFTSCVKRGTGRHLHVCTICWH